MDQQETIKEIYTRIERTGDLPVFSASVNRVRQISADPESSSMDLAAEVMKDPGFSVKLLRLANSSHYNRGLGKIGSVSRAVVLLGFNTVKNMGFTLKFIESFKEQYPGVDMEKMLVRAYLAAGFARDVAIKSGVKDPEESYICALLHNLGGMVCAYFLPEKFLELQRLRPPSELSPQEVERSVLGISLTEMGKALASQWGFSSSVVKTMDRYMPRKDEPMRTGLQLNCALSSLANQVLESLYLDHKRPDKGFQQILEEMAHAAGLKVEAIEASLSASFKMSCDLAREYGISSKMLQPVMREGEDEARDKTARLFAYYAAHQVEPVAGVDTVQPLAKQSGLHIETAPTVSTVQADVIIDAAARHTGSPQQQLEILQEITSLMVSSATITNIFTKVLEGIHHGVGFERVVLCLVNRDRASYAGRIALGKNANELKEYFSFAVDPQRDLFAKLLMEGGDVYVENYQDPAWRNLIRDDFSSHVKVATFMLSALRHQNKPVGVIYADKAVSGTLLSTEERRGFLQFIAQARLALQLGK